MHTGSTAEERRAPLLASSKLPPVEPPRCRVRCRAAGRSTGRGRASQSSLASNDLGTGSRGCPGPCARRLQAAVPPGWWTPRRDRGGVFRHQCSSHRVAADALEAAGSAPPRARRSALHICAFSANHKHHLAARTRSRARAAPSRRCSAAGGRAPALTRAHLVLALRRLVRRRPLLHLARRPRRRGARCARGRRARSRPSARRCSATPAGRAADGCEARPSAMHVMLSRFCGHVYNQSSLRDVFTQSRGPTTTAVMSSCIGPSAPALGAHCASLRRLLRVGVAARDLDRLLHVMVPNAVGAEDDVAVVGAEAVRRHLGLGDHARVVPAECTPCRPSSATWANMRVRSHTRRPDEADAGHPTRRRSRRRLDLLLAPGSGLWSRGFLQSPPRAPSSCRRGRARRESPTLATRKVRRA